MFAGELWGYHAFNLGVHLLAALTLFGIVRRTLGMRSAECGVRNMEGNTTQEPNHYTSTIDNSPSSNSAFRIPHSALAFAVAMLWALHPLQTESVTYIIQR